MTVDQSFLGKVFVVEDADARIRVDNDLMNYAKYKAGDVLPAGKAVGDFKLIPKGTKVTVGAVKKLAMGVTVYLVCQARSADGQTVLGWTSTRNLAGKFVNETIGILKPEPGAGQFGPNAAWSRGKYLGQVDLVEIIDATVEIERIAIDTVQAYFDLVVAAKPAGIEILLNSGFRSYPEQKDLYEGYVAGRPGYNTAAKPGNSKHQNGIAFDIKVNGFDSPIYDWLTQNATSHGFLRTVNGEPWHWEYDPARAATAKQKGTFKAPNVSN